MLHHVSIKGLSFDETDVADMTGEGFLPCVDKLMLSETVTTSTSFAAFLENNTNISVAKNN